MAAGWSAANKAAGKITINMQLRIFKFRTLIIVSSSTLRRRPSVRVIRKAFLRQSLLAVVGRFDNPCCSHAIDEHTAKGGHALTRQMRIDQLFHRSRKLRGVKVAGVAHVDHRSALRQTLHRPRLHVISKIAQYRAAHGKKLPERSPRGNDRLIGAVHELRNTGRVEYDSEIARV